jgi:uncharacterized protein YkvS
MIIPSRTRYVGLVKCIKEMHKIIYQANLMRMENFRDLDVDAIMIIEEIIKKWGMKA